MKYYIIVLLLLVVSGCKDSSEEAKPLSPIKSVVIEDMYTDSVSVRAIDILNDGSLAFAGSNGKYGLYNFSSQTWNTGILKKDSLTPSFRAVAHTAEDFFMLSVASPALLYKTGNSGMELVYSEDHPKAFYDSMIFWNDKEGIAMGDPTDSCISIIITRDGGKSWSKIACSNLPTAADGEAAFAASNSNIAVYGDSAWIITGGMESNVLFTGDKGKSWELYKTPLVQGKSTTGGYSIDFYNDKLGVIIGGDYTKPNGNTANKALTTDGGKTWNLIANGANPGYRSCIQFIPNTTGKELLAIGFEGVDYSKDQGASWTSLSEEGFFTVRFVNDSTAYAAGPNRISKLKFKR